MKGFYPGLTTREEIKKHLLFHGTCEPIEGPLRGGGYDNVLWCAETPAVAQNYIPESGIVSYLCKPRSFRRKDILRPEGIWLNIAKQMGFEPEDLEYRGRDLVGWRWKGDNWPTWQSAIDYLENELGYEAGSDDVYALKTGFVDEVEVVFPADYKKKGQLFIIYGREKLNIFDLSANSEPDLSDPQYHYHKLFRALEHKGYDGIKIWDWAQSKTWGNVGHKSIGLFKPALAKITYESIPAVNFDWKEGVEALDVEDTPEFIAWHRAKVQAAHSQGLPVPPELLNEYADLLKAS